LRTLTPPSRLSGSWLGEAALACPAKFGDFAIRVTVRTPLRRRTETYLVTNRGYWKRVEGRPAVPLGCDGSVAPDRLCRHLERRRRRHVAAVARGTA